MLKLCIFDMDGTVVNSIKSIMHFANTVLNKYGIESVDEEHFKVFVGNGSKNLVERLMKYRNADMSKFEEIHRVYSDTYHQNSTYLTCPYDGVLEMLKELKELGVKIAILSNKPDHTTRSISDSLFGSDIDVCFGARDGVKLKPDPQAVNEILSLFSAKPEECLYIGDTSTDMKTAENSGIESVGVLWGFRDKKELEEAGANHIVSSPAEIISIAKMKL